MTTPKELARKAWDLALTCDNGRSGAAMSGLLSAINQLQAMAEARQGSREPTLDDKKRALLIWDRMHPQQQARTSLENVCDVLSVQALYHEVPAGWVPGQPITEAMHEAACRVLTRATGLDGTPQRMLDAMLAAAPTTGKREPLTDAQRAELARSFTGRNVPATASPELWFQRGISAAERAHGITGEQR